MLFNSIEFAIFLPVVFLLYWLLKKNGKLQNIVLLVASYMFYGWWDWRFLSLILFSSIVDYSIGVGLLSAQEQRRKLLLWISLVANLGILIVFKYYNFFLDSFIESFKWFGMEFSVSRLNIILPVGISFYTFQTLSYSIDVYKRKMEPSKDLISFLTFVSFFPQLVAGPIERASHLLPQFHRERKFDYKRASDGMRQILWGLFKKIVIADNCALLVNDIFENYEIMNGIVLILGAIYFAIQIYCDFSGYSDIAIGTARLFGFDLMQKFCLSIFFSEYWGILAQMAYFSLLGSEIIYTFPWVEVEVECQVKSETLSLFFWLVAFGMVQTGHLSGGGNKCYLLFSIINGRKEQDLR